MLLLALPLAWGLIVLDVDPVVIVVVSTVASVALLAIWDGARNLPQGLVFWAKPEPLRDRRTGLYNPDGWTHQLEVEEDRCRRHGLGAGVLAFQVTDPNGQDVAVPVAKTLRRVCRGHDVLACLDEGSFAVLAVGSSAVGCHGLSQRLRNELEDKGFAVRVSAASRDDGTTLEQAWAEASRSAGDTPQGRIAV
jgi:GGDEF domain-containing protein